MSKDADNEDRGKRPSTVVQKYGRRGGSARKTKREDGSGFWQRVKDYVSPSEEVQVGTPRQRRASMAGRPLIPTEVLVDPDQAFSQSAPGAQFPADLPASSPPFVPSPVGHGPDAHPADFDNHPDGSPFSEPQTPVAGSFVGELLLRLPGGGDLPVAGAWIADGIFELAPQPANSLGLLRILDRMAADLDAAEHARPSVAPATSDVELPPALGEPRRALGGATAQHAAMASRPSELLASAADMEGPAADEDTAQILLPADEDTAQILLPADEDTAQVRIRPQEADVASSPRRPTTEDRTRARRHTGPVRGGAAATKVLQERDEERKRRISGSREMVSAAADQPKNAAPPAGPKATVRPDRSSVASSENPRGQSRRRGKASAEEWAREQPRTAKTNNAPSPLLDLPTPPSGLSLDSLDGDEPAALSLREGFTLGISFGFSRISAAVAAQAPELLTDASGLDAIPAIVCLPRPGEIFTGDRANALRVEEYGWCIVAPHRLLAESYKEASGSVLLNHLAMRTFSGTDGLIRFEAHGEIYSVVDLAALLLKELRLQGQRHLGAEVDGAVIAYPAQFGQQQLRGLKMAAKAAGFGRIQFVHPAAAALLGQDLGGFRGVAAVYDFGGSSFDFSLYRIDGYEPEYLESQGDLWLGGDDFDNVIAATLADRLLDDCGFDVRARISDWQLLLAAAEQIKCVFTNDSAAECDMQQLFPELEQRGLCYEIVRSDVFKSTAHLVKRSFDLVDRAIAISGIKPEEIGVVVASGGTTGLPAIRHALDARFGKRVLYANAASLVTFGAAKLALAKEE